MPIKSLPISQNLTKTFNKVKEKLGNTAAQEKLSGSHGARSEKIAKKSEAAEQAAMRKQLGVSSKLHREIQNSTDEFSPKNAKHAERLYDRATKGAGMGNDSLFTANGIHKAATEVAAHVSRTNPQLKGSALSEEVMNQVRETVLGGAHDAIDASKLSTTQKNTAKTLAKGLVNAMDYDAKSKQFIEKVGSKSFRQASEAEKGKRNTVQRFFDRGNDKLGARVSHATKTVSKLGSQAQNLGNTAARKTVNVATTVVAGTAVGASAAVGAALAPVGVAAKLAYNVGAGVVAGAKAAGSTIKSKSQADAEKIGAQFRSSEPRAKKTK